MSTKGKRLVRLFSNIQADLEPHCNSDTPRGAACSRFRERMRKRARLGNDKTLAEKAKSVFLRTNQEVCHSIALTDEEIRLARGYLEHILWQRTSRDVGIPQLSITDDDLFNNWRFGPGQSLGTVGTHAAEKLLASKWTCTSAAEPYVVRLINENPYLSSFHKDKFGYTELVKGSKLGTVPKNDETDRTICTEPLGNMVLQLAVGRILERALEYAGFEVESQSPKNKVFAWIGSLTNELATLDLSRASDMISPFLVRALLPEELFDLLVAIRSPYINVDGEWVQANMISTMGNGFTFPLMTLIMLSLIYANRAINHAGPTRNWVSPRETGVFGDDIVIPAQEYGSLCDILVRAGLVVNYDKSFSAGPFRESCGGDYWLGEDITPPYIKACDNPSDIYNTINKVVDWCARHNVYLPRTMSFFKELISQMSKVHVVPEWFGPEQGLITRDCPRHYEYLRVKPFRKTLKNEFFLMMLACGGYVESFRKKGKGKDEYSVRYTPRVNDAKFESRKGRLPSGYLHGWDPLCKGVSVSLATADLIGVLLG